MLGYAALTPKQIEQGIARLSDAIDDAIDDPATDMTALFCRPVRAVSGSRRQRSAHPAPRFRQQPALRNPPPLGQYRDKIVGTTGWRAHAGRDEFYQYPIKGLSAQPLARVELEAEKPFPYDRVFALARPGAPVTPASRNGPRRACS